MTVAVVALTGSTVVGKPLYATPSDDLLASLEPTADVNDFAGILSPHEQEQLEQRCKQLRAKTGSQLAVVTLQSLQGGQVDDFTVKLFRRWGVGQAEKDNGVMLLVSIDDRKVRIEVGYGLEPVLPDVLAGRIIQEQIVPAFRQKQYAAGLSAAVNRIADIVERNEPAPADGGAANETPAAGAICFTLFMIPWVSFPSLFIGVFLRQRQWVAVIFLLLFPAFAIMFADFAKMPAFTYVVIVVCVVGAALFGFFAKLIPTWGGRRGRGSAGDWSAWDWGGSSWNTGGSSWSGGGFSGGGGGSWGGFGGGHSGGGGASGGW